MVAHTWVGRHEVWLDHELVGREASLQELLPHELRERDVPAHPPGPRTQQPMHAQHHCHRSRRGAALPIARVHDPWPRHWPPKAILTEALLSKHHGLGAQEAVVVQRLYYGYLCCTGGVVDGG